MQLLNRAKHGLVGFDLGARCVKTAQVVLRDGEYLLRSAAVVPRGETLLAEGTVEESPQSTADELAAAAAVCERLKGRDAAALLSMSLCDLVQLEPQAGKRQSREDVARAFKAETHRWSCESVVDTWPVGLGPKKINAIAAPRPWADQAAADLAATGWDCQMIDALPWALARATALVDRHQPRRLTAALDWGFSRATFVLINDGTPALVRCLKDCAFERVLAAIEEAFRIGRRDAELLLAEQSRACHQGQERLPAAISEVVAASLARLGQEVRRTLVYWQSVFGDRTLETISIFGGGGSLPGVEESLRNATGVETQLWSLPVERGATEPPLPPLHLVGAAAGLSAAAWGAR